VNEKAKIQWGLTHYFISFYFFRLFGKSQKENGEDLAKEAPLFVSRQGGRLTRQQAHNVFKEDYDKMGLKGKVTTHSPRKTYALAYILQ